MPCDYLALLWGFFISHWTYLLGFLVVCCLIKILYHLLIKLPDIILITLDTTSTVITLLIHELYVFIYLSFKSWLLTTIIIILYLIDSLYIIDCIGIPNGRYALLGVLFMMTPLIYVFIFSRKRIQEWIKVKLNLSI